MDNSGTNNKIWITVITIILSIALSACSIQSTNNNLSSVKQIEGKGFTTPEDAVKAYIEGFKDSDLQRMTSHFAVESYVEDYDFEAQLERVKAYYLGQNIKVPNVNNFTKSINIENRKNQITNEILLHYMILSQIDLDLTAPITFKDEKKSDIFVTNLTDQLNNINPESIKLIGFISPASLTEIYDNDRNQEHIANLANIYGGNAITSCVAVIELNRTKYLLCADTIEYDGKWYLLQFNSNISQILGLESTAAGLKAIDSQYESEIKDLIVPTT